MTRLVLRGSAGGALLLIVVTGCARWTKPDFTEEQFAKDDYECRQEAMRYYTMNPFIAGQMLDACLRARGYTK